MNAATIGAWSGGVGALIAVVTLLWQVRQGTLSRAERDVAARDELKQRARDDGAARARSDMQPTLDLLRSQLADAIRDRDSALAEIQVLRSQINASQAEILRMINQRDQRGNAP